MKAEIAAIDLIETWNETTRLAEFDDYRNPAFEAHLRTVPLAQIEVYIPEVSTRALLRFSWLSITDGERFMLDKQLYQDVPCLVISKKAAVRLVASALERCHEKT